MSNETLRQGDYCHTTGMTRHQLEWTVEQFRKAGALDKDPAWELPLFKGAVTLVWDAIGLYHSNNPYHPERQRDVTGLLQAAYEGEPTPEEEEAWRAKEAFMQEKLYMEPGMAKKIAQAMHEQKPLDVGDTADYVNHPPHYQSDNGVECIDAIRAALGREGFIAHCRGTAMKYIYRAGQKGDALECLSKAGWYLDRAAEELEQ